MSYYKNQLKRLETSEFYKSIKLFDGQGNETNNMDLNLESLNDIIKYLRNEKIRLLNKKGW